MEVDFLLPFIFRNLKFRIQVLRKHLLLQFCEKDILFPLKVSVEMISHILAHYTILLRLLDNERGKCRMNVIMYWILEIT